MASLRKNYVYSLLSQLLVILLPVVTTPYLSRVLGENNLGIYDYILSIVNYFILFGCIGLNLYGQREIAASHDDPVKKSAIFYELMMIRTITMSVSLLIYYLVLTHFADQPRYYALLGIELVAALFDISWFYPGNEDFRMQSIRTIVVRSVSIACVFIFVKCEEDLDKFILCYALAILIGNLSLWFPLKGMLVGVSPRSLNLKRHILPVLIMFLPQIATNVYTQLDKTMIGWLTNHEYAQVTYYSQAEKIVKIAMTVITAIGGIMLSRMAMVISDKDEEKAKAYIRKSFCFMMLLAFPMMAGFAAVAEDFVPWFFGPGYDAVIPCLVLLSPLVFIIGVSNILGTQYLVPSKRMRQYTLSIVFGMVTNCVGNALLIPRFRSIGAVIATLIAETVVSVSQFIFLRVTFTPAVLLQGKKYFFAAALMGAAVYAVSLPLPGTIYATAIEAGAGVLIYFGLLLLMRDAFLLEQIRSVLPKLKQHIPFLK